MISKGKCFDPLTISLDQFFKKCMEAGVEKLYVDLGAQRINGYNYSFIAVSVDTNGSQWPHVQFCMSLTSVPYIKITGVCF